MTQPTLLKQGGFGCDTKLTYSEIWGLGRVYLFKNHSYLLVLCEKKNFKRI